jgi:hypothetical protein
MNLELLLLLWNLSFYGIKGKVGQSYLNCIKQRVEIESSKSYCNWGIVKHGVPQGSIIGPVLMSQLSQFLKQDKLSGLGDSHNLHIIRLSRTVIYRLHSIFCGVCWCIVYLRTCLNILFVS